MTTSTDAEPALYRENPTPQNSNRSNPAAAEATFESLGQLSRRFQNRLE
jgi:hypothetical protein